MQVKISNKKIWWYVGNNNKPSKTYMDNFKKEMNLVNLNVKFNSIENVEIVVKEDYLDITYIWLNHMNKDYFYIVSDIRIINNNSYILVCTLDLWNTFTLPYIQKLKDNKCEVLCNRSHLFDEKSIQFKDELLDGVFKEYESVNFVKKEFDTKMVLGEECYYNANVAIPTKDNINGVFYYVFNDGDNGNYIFIPLLKYKDEISNVYIGQGNTFINYVYDKFNGIVYQVDNDFSNYQELNINIEDTIQGYLNDGCIISYNIPNITSYKQIENANNKNIKDLMINISNSTSLLPSNIHYTFSHYKGHNNKWGDYSNFGVNWSINNNSVFGFTYKSYNWYENPNWKYSGYLWIKVSSSNEINFYTKYDSNNNKKTLDELRLSQQWSNKFLGIYFLPNVLNLFSMWEIKNLNNKNMLVCNVSYELKNITINLPSINYSNDSYFNNEVIANKNILKYINYNYYNNNVPLAYIYNSNNDKVDIAITGKINFTNCGNLYTKINLLPLRDTIFKFTGELPYGIDNYINYVNATKESANTSYNIAKQNAIKNGIFGVLGGISSIIPGVGGLLGSIGTKISYIPDFSGYGNMAGLVPTTALVPTMGLKESYTIKDNLGAMFGGLNIGQGAMQAISAGISAGLSVSQLAAKMKAHYADKNNTLGNTINISQDEDAMWILANQDYGQYEVVEFYNLTTNSIKALNNIIYLYGEYYPRIIDINSILSVGEDFSYIQLDGDYIKLNYYHLYDGVRNYFDIVVNELESGVRLIDYDSIITREIIKWKVPVMTATSNPGNIYRGFNMFYIGNFSGGYQIEIVDNYFNVEEFKYTNIDDTKNYIVDIDCENIKIDDILIERLKASLKYSPDASINIINGLYNCKDVIFKFENMSKKLTKDIFNFKNINKNIKKIYVNGEIWYAR